MKKIDTKFWNEYFQLYDILNHVHAYRELLDTVMSEMDLDNTTSVLDAGAGTGNLSVLLAKENVNITAIDSSSVGIEILEKKIPGHIILLCDLTTTLPFEDSIFDYLCCVNTLFSINPKYRPDICKEFFRVIKPGGKIILVNLMEKYRPIKIYIDHIRREIKLLGVFRAVINVARLVPPTIKLFYYSWQIKKDTSSGEGNVRLFAKNEQEELLKNTGFVDISPEKKVFAKQAVMTTAFKGV